MDRAFSILTGLVFGASLAAASGITFTCDPASADDPDTYAAGTCAYLNSTVAGYYSSSFTNANANIYIRMGSTGLGESTTGFQNQVTYAQYAAALSAAASASGNLIQSDASAALSANDSAYSNGNVELTSALVSALGLGGDVFGGNRGVEADGTTPCFNPGTAGCYNGIITVGDTAALYYDQLGETQASNQYDFFSVVEHETDEILGTASCVVTTASNGLLGDGCNGTRFDPYTPSAADLFRYNAEGELSLISSAVGQTDAGAGAYFSYNGGATNGANGFVYNTAANGDDYADFVTNCAGAISIQDAIGCPGSNISILNDGGAEINILNAVGYQEPASVPEPETFVLVGGGMAAMLLGRTVRKF